MTTRRLWLRVCPSMAYRDSPLVAARMTRKAILQAYRHLYRNALRATHHSSPAKYVIRETIRTAFRSEPTNTFNMQRIKNTEDFLKRAERDTGIEHRILKNLLHVRYWQHHAKRDNKLYVIPWQESREELTMPQNISANSHSLPDPQRKLGAI